MRTFLKANFQAKETEQQQDLYNVYNTRTNHKLCVIGGDRDGCSIRFVDSDTSLTDNDLKILSSLMITIQANTEE